MTAPHRSTGPAQADAVRAGTAPGALRSEVAGPLLLAGLAVWALTAGGIAGARWWPVAALSLASLAVLVAGRAAAPRFRHLPAVAVLVAAAAVAGARGGDLYGGPLDAPLGYANAAAAFAVLAAAAGLVLATRSPRRWVRLVGGAGAAGAATVPLLNGSLAGSVAVGALAAAPLIARGGAVAVRRLVAAGMLAVVASVATAVTLGVAAGSGTGAPGWASAVLTERRVVLWAESLTLIRAHPLAGVGPAGFAGSSPTATADADARHAHNEYLEVAVDLGIPAALLLGGAVLWGLARLRHGPLDAGSAVVVTAWAAVAVHAGVDSVLHSPAVALSAVALLAAGTAPEPG